MNQSIGVQHNTVDCSLKYNNLLPISNNGGNESPTPLLQRREISLRGVHFFYSTEKVKEIFNLTLAGVHLFYLLNRKKFKEIFNSIIKI